MMIRLQNAIDIAAPQDLVWAVSTDIERWPDWLPTVTSAHKLADEPFGLGGRYELKQPMQSPAVWEVTACNPGIGFTWKRQSGGLLQFEARHELEAHGTRTVNRLYLDCSGLLSGILSPVLKVIFALTLAVENKALKRRCEAVPPAT